MKQGLLLVNVVLLIIIRCSAVAWIYEGEWSCHTDFGGIAVGPRSLVYVTYGGYKNYVMYFSATGSYLGLWGGTGSGEGLFDRPSRIAVARNGAVYVADRNNHRIQYFTAEGSFLGKWGAYGTGNGEFNRPTGVAVSPNGDVYVADEGCERVQYFTATGSYLGQWGSYGFGNGQFVYPVDVAVSPNGTRVYVVDSSTKKDIQYFTSTGSFLGKWLPGFEDPFDIAVASNGHVYIADYWSHRIKCFTASGSLLWIWGRCGSGGGQFQHPATISFSWTGARFYVEDRNNYRIQYFNRNKPAVLPYSFGGVRAIFK
jgi:tripartite motif-containing protein 71